MIEAFVVGAGVGAAFGLFRLPVPAPPTLAGNGGVVGLFLGWYATGLLF